MTTNVQVRSARLNDAQGIADFVNRAHGSKSPVERGDVAGRFSEVGFLIAEHNDTIVGLLGWQVENLVARVTDYLISPAIDRVVAGRALIKHMEQEGLKLQAEAAILFLPPNPSKELISYWELFGYSPRAVSKLLKPWREAAREWDPNAKAVMVRQLRDRITHKPLQG